MHDEIYVPEGYRICVHGLQVTTFQGSPDHPVMGTHVRFGQHVHALAPEQVCGSGTSVGENDDGLASRVRAALTGAPADSALHILQRMRLELRDGTVDLFILADHLETDGRTVHMEVPKAVTDLWSWVEWDMAWNRLMGQWLTTYATPATAHRYRLDIREPRPAVSRRVRQIMDVELP